MFRCPIIVEFKRLAAIEPGIQSSLLNATHIFRGELQNLCMYRRETWSLSRGLTVVSGFCSQLVVFAGATAGFLKGSSLGDGPYIKKKGASHKMNEAPLLSKSPNVIGLA